VGQLIVHLGAGFSLGLDVRNDLLKSIDAESFLKGPDTLDIVGVRFRTTQDLVLSLVVLDSELVLAKVVDSDQ